MSILARAVAAREGAFFSETSKQAIARLREKTAARSSSPSTTDAATHCVGGDQEAINADVLPEILQHCLPRCHGAHHQEELLHYSLPSSFSPSPSSLASSLPPSHAPRSLPPHADRLGSTGLYAFLPNLPQASLGPRRWTPEVGDVKILASTANEARMEGMPIMDDAMRAKELMEGYAVVMKSFLMATALVVGGAIVAAGAVSSKLEIRSIDDIRTKGREHMQPHAEAIRQSVEPWKQWVDQRQLNIGDSSQHNAVSAKFARGLGLRQQPKEDVIALEVKTRR